MAEALVLTAHWMRLVTWLHSARSKNTPKTVQRTLHSSYTCMHEERFHSVSTAVVMVTARSEHLSPSYSVPNELLNRRFCGFLLLLLFRLNLSFIPFLYKMLVLLFSSSCVSIYSSLLSSISCASRYFFLITYLPLFLYNTLCCIFSSTTPICLSSVSSVSSATPSTISSTQPYLIVSYEQFRFLFVFHHLFFLNYFNFHLLPAF